MLEHAADSPIPEFWHQWYPVLIALLITLGSRLIGNMQAKPTITQLAAPIGVMAGWWALGGPHFDRDDSLPHRLAAMGTICVIGQFISQYPKFKESLPVIVAALGAWWLVRSPRTYYELAQVLPHLIVITSVGALGIIRLRSASPWVVLAAAATLWGSLMVVYAPRPWPMAAMVVAAACLGLVGPGVAHDKARDEIGPVAAIAFCAIMTDMEYGQFSSFHINPIDIACLSPLLVIAAIPQIMKNDVVAGSVAATLGSIAAVWLISLAMAYGI